MVYLTGNEIQFIALVNLSACISIAILFFIAGTTSLTKKGLIPSIVSIAIGIFMIILQFKFNVIT